MARKRKNGEGTVRLRKDGRWEGRVVVSYDERGYPKTKNVLAKTKAACIEKLKKLQEELGSLKSGKIKPDMPFGSWLDFWYQHYSKPKLRATTQSAYEGNIYLHIIPKIGAIPLNRLTQNDLQQFYAGLKKDGRLVLTELYGEGLCDRTVRACHARCRTALEKAVQEGLIHSNPAIGCKLPPKKAREMQVLTREEIWRFLIQAKAEGYYELFVLELTTGLRRGELMALRWEDVNWDTGELRIARQVYHTKKDGLLISQPKTKGSIRTIILPSAMLKILQEYRETVESRWMFPSPLKEDSPLDPETANRRLHIILEHAGCRQVRFHDLRHTFASNALANGMDVKTLSAILGHTSAATTLDIYTHITNDMQAAAAASIDREIGKAIPRQDNISANNHLQASGSGFPSFVPYCGGRRRAGTGCITQLGPNRWEGRYSPMWPDRKKHSRNVYTKTREECEEKLKVLIAEMKAEIMEAKKQKAKAKVQFQFSDSRRINKSSKSE